MLCRVLPLLEAVHLPLTCKVYHWLLVVIPETLETHKVVTAHCMVVRVERVVRVTCCC